MDSERRPDPAAALPSTRHELATWMREAVALPEHLHNLVLAALENVIVHQEHLWQSSKQEAIRALSRGFADRLAAARAQLAAKDATVSQISNYFEQLVGDLNERIGRDAKTNLLNFPKFEEALTVLLATERRGRRCAVGLVDVAQFKWYNDACGHPVGDQIIEAVSRLLRQHVRAHDLVATEPEGAGRSVHARFGGDEFCFLLADLGDLRQVVTICDRFSDAVSGHDWARIDARLAERPVRVDIGVACLQVGPLADRRFLASRLAQQLIGWGDAAMYRAKAQAIRRTEVVNLHIERGELVEVAADAEPESVEHSQPRTEEAGG
jgi:diguanylate cyclase (GGDEF)-like protein